MDDNVNWEKHLKRFVRAEKNHMVVDGMINKPSKVADIVIE